MADPVTTFVTAKTTFISAKAIKSLWKKLARIRDDRSKEIHRIGNVFGSAIELAKYYIEPDCQHHNPADHNEGEPISAVRSPIFKTINEFLNGTFAVSRDGRNTMFILSDAGMGKTSLLMMLRLAHLTAFWPKKYNCSLLKLGKDSIEEIRRIENKTDTVLLLDALDEDPEAWGRISQRLQEILVESINFNRVIISCRTQFFPEGAADPFGLPGRVKLREFVSPVIFLSLFDDMQVEQYLRKRFCWSFLGFSLPKKSHVKNAGEIVQKMESLRFRPFLLAHIEDILSANQKHWNEFRIYRALVDTWLAREKRKLSEQNKNIRNLDLLKACTVVAEWMQINNKRNISGNGLSALLSEVPDTAALKLIDIGGRSLLNRNSDGDFRFSHYTVQEFLVAELILRGNLNTISDSLRITDQILRFVIYASCSGIRINDDALIKKLTGQLTRQNLKGLNLEGLVLPKVSLHKAILEGANLKNANLSGADLTGANFTGANLTGANLSNACLAGAILSHAICQGTDFRQSDLTNANFLGDGDELHGTNFRAADFRGAILTGAQVRAAQLMGATVRGATMDEILSSELRSGMATINLAQTQMNNFTPRATQVLALARKEADRFNHNFVGTEHIVLGLIRLHQGTGVAVLHNLKVDLEVLRKEIEKQIGTGPDQKMIGNIPYTPRVKKVLALAGIEAQALNHTYIGTEHILLGVLREGDGVPARVMKNLGVELEQARREILEELDPHSHGKDRKPSLCLDIDNSADVRNMQDGKW